MQVGPEGQIYTKHKLVFWKETCGVLERKTHQGDGWQSALLHNSSTAVKHKGKCGVLSGRRVACGPLKAVTCSLLSMGKVSLHLYAEHLVASPQHHAVSSQARLTSCEEQPFSLRSCDHKLPINTPCGNYCSDQQAGTPTAMVAWRQKEFPGQGRAMASDAKVDWLQGLWRLQLAT